MSFTSLFFSNPRKLGSLSIDCVVTENHKSALRVTHNPVEFGASINDHAIIMPKEYMLNGVVSNLPNNFLSFQLPNWLSGTAATRASSAYEILLNLQATREPINVQTGLKLYRNMILEEITVSQDSITAGGLYFQARLKEIIIIQNKSVQIDSKQYKSGATRNAASPTVKKGLVQGEKQELRSIAKAGKIYATRKIQQPPVISGLPPGSIFELEENLFDYFLESDGFYQNEVNYL